jgi:hypothetical protein
MHDRGYEPDARGRLRRRTVGTVTGPRQRNLATGTASAARTTRTPAVRSRTARCHRRRPQRPTQPDAAILAAQNLIKECDTKLDRYRQTLDAGADPAVVTTWITQTQAERRHAENIARGPSSQPAPGRMTHQQINDLVNALGDIIATLAKADPTTKPTSTGDSDYTSPTTHTPRRCTPRQI